MTKLPVTLPKELALKPAEDFYRLRREGIGYIEQMGSQLWTDYNTHDPGITTLEALSYAITDLAYRTGWGIKDILALAEPAPDASQPFPHQPFFTARQILTVNPWTTQDFRRLLIDLDTVRNAWVICKACACEVSYYLWCKDRQPFQSYEKPPDAGLVVQTVKPSGFYDVLLELESDPELGDLNDRKLEQRYVVLDTNDQAHDILLELRMPEWHLLHPAKWMRFIESDAAFAGQHGASFAIDTITLKLTKEADDPIIDDAQLRAHWRDVFYVSFGLTLNPGDGQPAEKIRIENAALRLFGTTVARAIASVPKLLVLLQDKTGLGMIQRYRNKLRKVQAAVATAKSTLYRHRNLAEDYCHVRGVSIEDIAVCADVVVAPSADIEQVQAQIWFRIEQYLNPPLQFYSLSELIQKGLTVEEIFDGPVLNNGFLQTEALDNSELRILLRTSDMINVLMDIPGVVAINNLLLSKYDEEGVLVKGAADPLWDQIIYSRGRFLIEGTRQSPIIVPARAEVARVIEDCRG